MVDHDLVGAEEAARILGCSAVTVRKLIHKGQLSAVTADPFSLERSEVWAFLERRRDSQNHHGPECQISYCDLWDMAFHECQCVACHCPTFVPGGFLGTCDRCGRPLVVNGRVVR